MAALVPDSATHFSRVYIHLPTSTDDLRGAAQIELDNRVCKYALFCFVLLSGVAIMITGIVLYNKAGDSTLSDTLFSVGLAMIILPSAVTATFRQHPTRVMGA